MVRILLVEDDAEMRYGVRAALRSDGLAVDAVPDVPEADEALAVNDYDCAVFDRILPGGDAINYVQDRRAEGWALPVLFLTARDALADVLAGFEHGGDDYLIKPFAVAELIARVRVLCRRSGSIRPPILRFDGIRLDAARRQVWRDEVLLTLTAKEFAVLERLMIQGDAVCSRSDLIEHCWDEMAEPSSNVVDVIVTNLRRKLGGPPVIETIRGAGYRLTAD